MGVVLSPPLPSERGSKIKLGFAGFDVVIDGQKSKKIQFPLHTE